MRTRDKIKYGIQPTTEQQSTHERKIYCESIATNFLRGLTAGVDLMIKIKRPPKNKMKNIAKAIVKKYLKFRKELNI